jgi:hypothetical protein
MKQRFMAAALAVAIAPFAAAVEFNKDALKSMQEEGHKIVEEAQGRAYRAAGGLCLDIAGGGLSVKPCDAKAKTQVWQIDGKGRLVAGDGRCVAGDKLQKCGSGNAQKWKVDGNKRLANAAKQCLQVKGSPPKAGAKVIAVACSKSPNQVWQ